MKRLFTYLLSTILGCFALTGQTTHFTPVWSGNGYMHMNFYLHERTFNGTALDIGDEIAVFDGEFCVGTCVIAKTTSIIALIASADDPITPNVTDGFVTGHTPTFKIWLAESGTEITNITVEVVSGSLSFCQLGDVEVSLHGTTSAPNAPEISSITQPSCSVATGSVTLSNLPSNGQWTLTMFPGGTETFSSSGTTYTVSNLSSGSYTFTVTDYLGLTSEQSSEITINPQPVTPSSPDDIDGNTTVCSGSSQNYSIDDVSGATDYIWSVPQGWTISGGQGSVSISVTAGSVSGTISVTPSNECGQGNPATLAVTVKISPEQPSVISGNTSTCQGTSGLTYSVIAVVGVNYSWTIPQGWNITEGQNSNAITVTAGNNSGSITVTPSNSCGNGPARSLPVSVNAKPPQPGAISGNSTICQGSEQLYSIETVTGATSYSWTLPNEWSGSSSTNAITASTGLTGGTISVTANNSCGASTPRTLNISVTPDPDAPTISMTQPTCSTPTGTITVTAPKENGMRYSIDGSNYSNSAGVFSGLVSGSYTVTAKNATGCISSGTPATIIEQLDTPSTPVVGTITQPTCEVATGSVVLSNLPASGDWIINRTPGNVTTSGSGTTKTISGLPADETYTFTVTNSDGCTSLPSADVVINAQPVKPSQPAAISGNTTICQGSEQLYSIETVNGATSYAWTLPNGWSGNSSTNAITASAGSTGGSISVTANNSCGASTPRTLNISVTPDPNAPTILMTQPTCGTPTGTITVTAPKENGMRYSIDGNNYSNSTGVFSGLTSGSYTVTAKNATGCISSGTSATIIEQPKTPSAPVIGTITQPTAELQTGSVELNQLPNPDDWNITKYPDLAMISGSGRSFVVEGLESGVYTFTVTNGSGCTSEESDNVIINSVTSSISDNSAEDFSLFPNPAKDIIYLKPPKNYNETIFVEVVDMLGKTLLFKKINNPSSLSEINLCGYRSGVYFIIIVTENKTLTYKIIHE